MTLLSQRDTARRRRRIALCSEARNKLHRALADLVPGVKVIVFGSLIHPEKFNDKSDIDIALESEPPHMDVFRLTSELMERLERPVDVVLLGRCRFRDKILREGDVWIV